MAMEISTKSKEIELNPTLDTSAYADGDHMSNVMELANAVRGNGEGATISDIVVIDKGKVKQAFDILFFRGSPTVASSANASLDISDSEMASKYAGKVSVGSSDYTDLSACSEATISKVGVALKPSGSETSMYAILKSRGTGTYAAAGLTIWVKLYQD